jgi:hypothetical protein
MLNKALSAVSLPQSFSALEQLQDFCAKQDQGSDIRAPNKEAVPALVKEI